ncbi:hypothetical protein HII31_03997 [Pseudocercospora fuligena]|uniref:Uncharacterized protein n=1 Tax=Pseudocercospora fuligena TaxID=685502 RepID=A0A8H6VQ21_9PEZI|nr:hypothetical protein HII31_03997 [Pseudocercospora fuligena]
MNIQLISSIDGLDFYRAHYSYTRAAACTLTLQRVQLAASMFPHLPYSRLFLTICIGVAILLLLASLVHFKAPPNSIIQTPRSDLLDDTSKATLRFQKIFIINLPSRTDCRDAATLAAAFTGLEVEFVNALTHVDEKFLPPGVKDASLKKGEVGAWRSHLNVIERQGFSNPK